MALRRAWIALLAILVLAAGLFLAARVLAAAHRSPAALSVSGTGARGPASALIGAWRVGGGSQAGYRAREKFVNQPDVTEAVARTASVTGGLVIDSTSAGLRVRGIDFSVDLRTLASQDTYATFQTFQRDFFVRRIYLESDQFPMARFRGSELSLPPEIDPGAQIRAPGRLTVHGTTRDVVAQVQVQIAADAVDVSGSIPVDMRDFNIEVPDIAFTTAQPGLVIEFLLHLTRT